MTATVRLDNELEDTLQRLARVLQKKKSTIIREAIHFYATSVEQDKKSRILNAIAKTKEADGHEHRDFESTIDDGI